MSKPSFQRRLGFENLERRQLLAGNVVAGLDVNGNLVLSGDLSDNHVVVTRGTFSSLLVTGGRSVPGDPATVTRINGQTGTLSFNTTGGLVLNMSDGNDRVLLTRIGLAGAVTGSLGKGNDQLAFESDEDGPLSFTLNNGNEPNYGSVSTSGGVNVGGNDGNDTLVMYDAIIGGDLTFLGGNGDDLFNSGGTDTDDNVVGGSVQLTPGAGNDSISVFRLAVGGNFRVDDGSAVTQTNVGITNLRANLDILMNLSIRRDVVVLRGESASVRFQARNVIINTGDGWDNVNVRWGTMENLTVSTGNGNEGSSSVVGVSLTFLGIGTTLLLDTGSGVDAAFLSNITVETMQVDTGDGADRVVANNMEVDDAIFTTSFGNDFVGLHESRYETLEVYLEEDDDVLQVRNLTTTRDTFFDGGLGFNLYRDQGGNSLRSLTRVNF